MKKTAILAAVLCGAVSLSVLAGCGGNSQNVDPSMLYGKTESLIGGEVGSEIVPQQSETPGTQKTESAIHSAEPSSEGSLSASSETSSSAASSFETSSEEKVLTQMKSVNAGGITLSVPGTWDESSSTANTDNVYYAYEAPGRQGGLVIYPDAYGFLFTEDPDSVKDYTTLEGAIDKWYQNQKDRGSEMTRGETTVAGYPAEKFLFEAQGMRSELYFVKTSGDKGAVLYFESNFDFDQMETHRDEIFSSIRF